ncbi:hypothetical protein KAI87_11225 [Myxococcota bacterium]|nr:hypothetical protein [Myxococcota bacterium]
MKIQPKVSEQAVQQVKIENKAPAKQSPAASKASAVDADSLGAAIKTANNNPPAHGRPSGPAGGPSGAFSSPGVMSTAQIDSQISKAIGSAKVSGIFSFLEDNSWDSRTDLTPKRKIMKCAESLKGKSNYSLSHATKLAAAVSKFDSASNQSSTFKHYEASEIINDWVKADLKSNHTPAQNLKTATRAAKILAKYSVNPSGARFSSPPGDLILNYHTEMYEHPRYTPAIANKLSAALKPYDGNGSREPVIQSGRQIRGF